MYFNVNFNVFFKLIKVRFSVSEPYIYQNARCNDKKIIFSIIGLTSLLCVPFNSVSSILQHVYYDYRCLLYPGGGYLRIQYGI